MTKIPGEKPICRHAGGSRRGKRERGGRLAPFARRGLRAWRYLRGLRRSLMSGPLPGRREPMPAAAGGPRRAGRVVVCVAALSLLGGCGSAEEKEAGRLPVHCLDEPDRGPCHRGLRRYYYDYPSDSCRMFFYGGCGGRVPFETRADCEATCVAGRD